MQLIPPREATEAQVTAATAKNRYISPRRQTGGGTNPTLNGYNLTGARTVTATSLAGTEIDVSKPESVKAISADTTLTFSATLAEGKEFRLTLNATGGPWVVTFPESYSPEKQSNQTTVTVPSGGTVILVFRRTASRYEVLGLPPATVGSGSFVLATEGNTAGFIIDGGGSAIAADTLSADIVILYPCTITHHANYARGTTPTLTWDILRVAAGTSLPSASIIGAGTKPGLTSANGATWAAPASWTATTFAAGDVVCAKLATNDTATRATLQLKLTRT
jgi:hypothetical protein